MPAADDNNNTAGIGFRLAPGTGESIFLSFIGAQAFACLQGFDEELHGMLQRHAPRTHILRALMAGAAGVLQEVLLAFPNQPDVPGHDLLPFENAVQDLNK